MRKVTFSLAVSLDGYIDGPRGEAWVIADDAFHHFAAEQLRAADVIVFGRVTYEASIGYWRTAAANPASTPGEIEFAGVINSERLAKVVFSKTLDRVEWNARLARGNLAEEIMALKQQPGKDVVIAGPSLGAALAPLGLIDEYHLFVHPVLLGSGTPMFGSGHPPLRLRLMGTQTFGSGVVVLSYQADRR